MRSLEINKRPLYYALFKEKTEIVDGNGNATGEYTKTYNTPVLFNVNWSGGRGSVENDPFGANVVYSMTLSTTDMSCPIDEYSVLWVDADPEKVSYNYVVAAKPIKTLNSILIPLREVDVKAVAQNA